MPPIRDRHEVEDAESTRGAIAVGGLERGPTRESIGSSGSGVPVALRCVDLDVPEAATNMFRDALSTSKTLKMLRLNGQDIMARD
ncbi:hypothetical protein FRB94_001558 [Tulasnella sp. JGI-2019a]|nr:hypothetical protein FRB93_012522 [Tulasnella sp. JGI-2019a]KAG9005473.1 hypothetical protein FRB94_001558 [Tulasnella sp. JGI-2019a]KAG9028991.1 hypothetical protein FRB95_005859 [Tulasnella sp. JGI-2019a]